MHRSGKISRLSFKGNITLHWNINMCNILEVSVTTIFSSNSMIFKHELEQESGKSHLISQGEMNDLVRDFNLKTRGKVLS